MMATFSTWMERLPARRSGGLDMSHTSQFYWAVSDGQVLRGLGQFSWWLVIRVVGLLKHIGTHWELPYHNIIP